MKTGTCDISATPTLCRSYAMQGYKLPVTPEGIAHIARCAPDNYLSLVTWNREQPVAAALMVRVSDTVLYHFLSGFLPEFGALSPSLMLFEAAYQFGRDNRVQILDLGISLDHLGYEKPALAGFKKRIGGIGCDKVTYEVNF